MIFAYPMTKNYGNMTVNAEPVIFLVPSILDAFSWFETYFISCFVCKIIQQWPSMFQAGLQLYCEGVDLTVRAVRLPCLRIRLFQFTGMISIHDFANLCEHLAVNI